MLEVNILPSFILDVFLEWAEFVFILTILALKFIVQRISSSLRVCSHRIFPVGSGVYLAGLWRLGIAVIYGCFWLLMVMFCFNLSFLGLNGRDEICLILGQNCLLSWLSIVLLRKMLIPASLINFIIYIVYLERYSYLLILLDNFLILVDCNCCKIHKLYKNNYLK